MEHILPLIAIAAVVVVVVKLISGKASPTKVAQALRQGAVIVDVRTADEFASGHADGATNIPLQALQGRLEQLEPKDQPIVLYCHSGMRAGSAQVMLKQAGFTNVINAGTMTGLRRARKLEQSSP